MTTRTRTHAATVALTDATFDELVAGSGVPVLVEFTAEWCPPCRAIAPMLEALAVEERDRLTVACLDVDANPEVTRRYGVLAMPTLVLFVDGKERRRVIGARGKGQLLRELADHLPPRPAPTP